MNHFMNIDEILNFAINAEQEAFEFYKELSEKASGEEMRKVFEQFAQEEIGHKSKLIRIKETGNVDITPQKVSDLKIADYVVDVVVKPGITYQEALVVAMKKEKAAFRLYMDLMNKTDNADMKALFLALAQEESKHKLRFEIEYDDHILKEN